MLHLPALQGGLPQSSLSQTNNTVQPAYFRGQGHAAELNGPVWDGLAVFGNGVIFASGILRLFMPLLNKGAKPITQVIGQGFSKAGFELSPGKYQKMSAFLADRNAIQKATKRFVLFGLFLQGINMYQTAVNSRQPALVIGALIRDLTSFIGIFRPTNFIFSMVVLAHVIETVGKVNDIENNNHPERRRDWDLNRLTRFLSLRKTHESMSGVSFGRECKSFFGFIADDLQQVFSLNHWKALKQIYRQRESWGEPQSSMMAISGQFAGSSWLLTQLQTVIKKPLVNLGASIGLLLSLSMFITPMMIRGWQNRADKDGKLVLAGAPLMMIGSLFMPQYTQKWFFLNGLAGIGGPMFARGLSLNSKNYRALADMLDVLRIQAAKNPRLTADAILRYLQSNRSELKQLQKRVGENRGNYLLNLLRKADLAQKSSGISLTVFLAMAAELA